VASPDCVVTTSTENVDPTMTASATLAGISLTGSGVSIPALSATWSTIANVYITGFEFQFTNSAGSSTYVDSTAKAPALAWNATDGIVAGATYSVRYRATGTGVVGPWSNWVSVTVPSAFIAGSATTVTWSGVTGSGKPADNATVGAVTGVNLTSAAYGTLTDTGTNGVITILTTASAITGQAAAATDGTIQAGATKNILTASSTAPTSPTNGDLWLDESTTPYTIGSTTGSNLYSPTYGYLSDTGTNGIVTSQTTAAAFIGQTGWATTTTYTPTQVFSPGQNLVYNGSAKLGSAGIADGVGVTLAGGSYATAGINGQAAFAATANVVFTFKPVPVTPGSIYSLQAGLNAYALSAGFVRAYVLWVNASGGGISSSTPAVMAAGGYSSSPVKVQGFAAPSTAATATVVCDTTNAAQSANTATFNGLAAAWSQVKFELGSTCTPFSDEATNGALTTGIYSPTYGAQSDASLITQYGTASAITGQSPLATASSLAYGSSYLTGFGALSPLGAIYYGSPYLTETSGGTQATLANFKTSLGTASAIAGQGYLATQGSITWQSAQMAGMPNWATDTYSGTYVGPKSDYINNQYTGANLNTYWPATTGSDKTSNATAAAIAGQALIATSGSYANLSGVPGVGANQATNTDFRLGSYGWSTSGNVIFTAPAGLNYSYTMNWTQAAAIGSGSSFDFAASGNSWIAPFSGNSFLMAVQAGDYVYAMAKMGQKYCQAQLYLLGYSATGSSLIWAPVWSGATDYAADTYVGNGDPVHYTNVGGIAIVPAGVVWLGLMFCATYNAATSAANPAVYVIEPALGKVAPGSSTLPAYQSGQSGGLPDSRTLPLNVNSGSGFTFNPALMLSSPTPGTTITVAACVLTLAGVAYSLPAATISGLSPSTTYAVFYNGSSYIAVSSGATPYYTATSGYYAMGVITTAGSTGGGTGGGGGGGGSGHPIP
jgi:hypothetical protein